MILELIQNYIAQKSVVVNANYTTDIQLKQIVTELDLEQIGASESFIHFQLFIPSIEKIPQETAKYDNVLVRLDFIILIANKDYTIYKKVFDRYLFAFMRVLKKSKTPMMSYRDEDISAGLTLVDVYDVKITNGDNFEDDYYRPSIEFTLKISDDGTLSNNILKSESV